MATPGISFIVCCWNSASRLGEQFAETIRRIAAQPRIEGIPWEVVIVDNASSDGTGEFATASWPHGDRQALRILHEGRSGLSFACERGLNEARYEYVCFIDDDNWIARNWLTELWRTMQAHPEAGAIGGYSEPLCDTAPPPWLPGVGRWLALGAQGDGESDVSESTGSLWGAGLTVRKSAWDGLHENGFHFRLTNRREDSLSAGGDDELCLALRLAGWRLWYCPTLRLQHLMPARRLVWSYMLTLARAAGESSIGLDAYYHELRNDAASSFVQGIRARVLGCWSGQMITSGIRATIAALQLAASAAIHKERHPAGLRLQYEIGRLRRLPAARRDYAASIRQVNAVFREKNYPEC